MSKPSRSTGPHGKQSAPSASERVYEWVRAAILSGDVPEGEFLDEQHVAHAVGTSRTPVREALQRLQADRFIDLLPRRGAQVRVINALEMQQVYDTRFILESHAIRELCAEKRPAPEVAGALLAKMDEARQQQDWIAVAQLDQAFHSSFVAELGNHVLAELYDSLRPRQIRLSLRTMAAAFHRLELIMAEHEQIIAATNAGDADAAISALRAHLKQVPEIVQALK